MSPGVDRLTGLDQLMLRVSRRWPQEVGALAVLDGHGLRDPDGRVRIEVVLDSIGSKLHRFPRLRQVVLTPGRGLGGPVWVDDPRFDLREHVRVERLPEGSGEADLLAATERLRRTRLDPSRPLWELWLLPGLPEGQIAMFVRLHHSIADGMAAMATISALLDTAPDVPIATAPPWTPSPAPSSGDLRADNLRRCGRKADRVVSAAVRPRRTLRRARAAWPAIRELFAEEPADDTSLNRTVGPHRNLAVVRTELEPVREAAHACDATVNDVLLAITAGAVGTLLRSRGEPVEGTTVRIYVPVSLRPGSGAPQRGNLIAQMAVPLRLGTLDPYLRLRQVGAETAERKARMRTSLGSLIGGPLTRRLVLMAVMRQRVNLMSASLAGPTTPLYLTGARVLEVVPVLPLIADEPLGVAALSYAGALTIGIVADRDAFPDLEIFTTGVRDELEALGVGESPAPLMTSGRS
jgi:WS/DGAT/MGAT family acyltransferase